MKLNRPSSFLLAALIVSLAACNTVPLPQSLVQTTQVRSLSAPDLAVSPDVIYLKTSINSPDFSVDSSGQWLYFSKGDPELAQVKVGNILNAGINPKTPYGILKKVVNILNYNDNLLIIQVENASLDEAIEGNLNQEADLDPSTVSESKLSEGVAFSQGAIVKNYGGSRTLRNFKYDFANVKVDCGDSKSTINGFIEGQFTAYLDTDFEKNFFRVPKLNKPKLFEAGLKFTGKTQLKIAGKCNLKNEIDIPLVQQSFPGYEFGIPFVFSIGVRPFIKISVGVSGEIFVEGSYVYTFEGSRNNGVRWTRDSGWNAIQEETGLNSKEDFQYSAGAKLQTFAKLGLGIELYAQVLSFGASASVYVEVKPYLELLAQTPPPKLCVYVGLDVSLRADARVISRQFGPWEKLNYSVYRKELLCKAGTSNPNPATLTGPCRNPDGTNCVFDTRALTNYPGVGFVESITAYGKVYNFDINGKEWIGGGNGMDLQSVARYASGPCASVPAGQPCTFDTRTTIDYPGVGYVESITAYGKAYNYDVNGNEWIGGGNGMDLRSVSRYASGPCASAPAGQPCTFDTRALSNYPGVGFLETITAYGKFWNFDINGNEWVGGGNGTDLRSVPRYASGPCASAPAGQSCVFDTLTMTDYPGAGFVQSITAYGKAYNFDINGNPWAGNGTDLKSVPRFASATPSQAPAAGKTNINFPRFIDPCSTPYDVDLKCEITKNYTEMLSRRPDDAGLQYWLNSGMNGETLRYQFAYSQEAANLIQVISRACLLRDADPTLLSTWQNYMLRGWSIASVAYAFSTSAESNQKGNPCRLTSNIQ